MQDFISAIFSNIFILGAVLYGVFSLFRNAREEKQGNESLPSQGSSSKEQPTLEERYEEMKNSGSDDEGGDEIQVGRASSTEHDTILDHGDLIVDKQQDETEIVHPFMEEKWTKKRLRDGVIMSEILGPPRSKKPHRTFRKL